MDAYKIIITSTTGYGLECNGHRDRLTLTDHSVTYSCVPLINLPHLLPRSNWHYTTKSEDFKKLYHEVAKLLEKAITEDGDPRACDADLLKVTLCGEKGLLLTGEFWGPPTNYQKASELLQKVVPPLESIPKCL